MSKVAPSRRWLADLRTAGAFLTIIPLGRGEEYRPGSLARAAWCFPLIGLLAGAAGGLVYALAIWSGASPSMAATLCVAALVAITGGLHEDGLGDFADALGGANRARRLAIMHDPRAGNFAVVALILLFAGRIGALADLATPERAGLALLVAAAVSRGAMVVVMHLLPAARSDGLSAGAGRPSSRGVALTVLLCVLVAFLVLGPWMAAACLCGAALMAMIFAVLARRRLGGQTGDVLGAVQLVAEFGCLAAATLFA
ncbi:MAG: adenosylcobinamide-GDP ribazoletransferase [Alphaproteobacteria bacterium]